MQFQKQSRWNACVLACLILLMACIPSARLFGHDEDHPHSHPHPVPDAEAHRPSPLPDRILLTWKGNPATTQAVTWRTDSSVERAVAQIAEAEDGPMFVKQAAELAAETTLLESDLGAAHYHTVDFQGLKPKTMYVYRVGDGANWSAWIHFRTASQEPEAFSFIYFGDAQNDVKSHWSRVFREAFSDAPRARFMLHAGDLINRANRDAEWGEWCSAGGWVNAMIPTVAIPGNHEYERKDENSPYALSRHWRPMFEYPEHGPEGLRETVYWFDYQGARIIGLNTNEQIEAQAVWLEEVLKSNPSKWTIVTHHAPIYCTKANRENLEIKRAWQPLFDKYRVDLVLQGHDHSYGRTNLRAYENVPEGVNVRSPEAGTLYVVSVSGPKMYDGGPQPFVRRAQDTQLYQIITVDGEELRYEARTARGILYDAFTLRKRLGQVNELIEQVPDTPERLRPAPPEEPEPAAEKKPQRAASANGQERAKKPVAAGQN